DCDEALRLNETCAVALRVGAAAHAELAGQALGRRDFDEAVTHANEASRLSPDFAPAYSRRGVALLLRGDQAAAVRDLSEAIRLQPQSATFYANRAWAHNLGGAFAEALRDCDEALRLNPNLTFALETRTAALRGLGRQGGDRP